jgi:hypothetical protein
MTVKVWHNARKVMAELKSPEKEEAAGFFYPAVNLSTWYFAVLDRANMTSEEFFAPFNLVAEKIDLPFEKVSQSLFRDTVKVFEQFLEGKVQLEQLKQLKAESKRIKELYTFVAKAITGGRGEYEISQDAIGYPRAISDSLYPLCLALRMEKYVSSDGSVILPSARRKLLAALIADGATRLARINQPHNHSLI